MSCMQATAWPMMQTVIRWRRPSEIESSRYPSAANPCSYLLGNSLCYVISGSLLLVVGVIITSLTFQNLDSSSGENKERYAGPVLIAAGVLVMARGALGRLWPRRTTLSSRRQSLLRRYIRELYSRPIFALQRNSTFSNCDMEVSDLYHVSSRTSQSTPALFAVVISWSRLYSDDPPSYDIVTNSDYLYPDAYVHAYTNPATEVEDEEDIYTSQLPVRIVIGPIPDSDTPNESHCLPNEDHSPPPSYDEYIMSASMKTTAL